MDLEQTYIKYSTMLKDNMKNISYLAVMLTFVLGAIIVLMALMGKTTNQFILWIWIISLVVMVLTKDKRK